MEITSDARVTTMPRDTPPGRARPSTGSDADSQITLEFTLGLMEASKDREVKDALDELGDVMPVLLRRYGNADDPRLAARAIADFALREAGRLRAVRRDLGLKHFTRMERELLDRHPTGGELLRRMADGDESAVAPARDLVDGIRRERAELGFDA
jgi:hypothetical protein